MKKNLIVLFVITILSVTSCSFTTKKFDADSDKDKVLIELISFVVSQGHYDMKNIDDEFSAAVYKDFIKSIDPMKRYFTKGQISELQEYETEIDDAISDKNIDFFNHAHQSLTKQMQTAETFYEDILSQPFDFTKTETISTDYDNIDYTSSDEELKERWRDQLKFSTLATYADLIKDEENKVENEEGYTMKSKDSLEIEARDITRKSMENYFSTMSELERKDWFSIYVNSIVSQFDPHTNYLAPQDKERFDISMSGKLEGIGARLQKQRDEVKILEVISGGPAWKNGQLEVGDIIQKVKQEDEDQAVTITGMRLEDAVDLIKGPKETVVTLTVKKVDGSLQNIQIIRDVVEIEETYAKSATTNKDGRKYGIINLPKFYFDVNDYKERNAASDIKKQIEFLQKENAEGLIIDLRNNGGGSLSTVVDIAGFFIENGPVVQVRDKQNDVDVLKDKDKKIIWEKPLVILVNELSASASEILAAAMQDYERAVIIGSKQTYGKGTVQNVVDLNRWMRNSSLGDMGALKITTQKFYRINGGSTQLKGVASDVAVPDRYSYIDLGERDYENPMPWDKIEPADYKKWNGYSNLQEVIKESSKRLLEQETIKLIDENAQWIRTQRDEKAYSLNYIKYQEDEKALEEMSKKFEAISDYQNNLTFNAIASEAKTFKTDTTLAEKRERWFENLTHDVYIEEAVTVLSQLKTKDKAGYSLKARKN
ncbi:carboxy terminal-processing peptidase [Psychroflexus halocasei]|uniref:Carboxyl-terminal processing protease n=1 Tax=Psychroflexus halocasei TaxID=908615 RepID=A0A1H4CFU4_9FLAO|nr:carboxy terminal-processing peptidase [Psychroflexus halocasei]SEA59295.1 carboxyl-terminal processing protease [Psychroflexus halocasei]